MKKIIILIIFVILFSMGCQKEQKNDNPSDNISTSSTAISKNNIDSQSSIISSEETNAMPTNADDKMSIIEELYRSFYIGEAFPSGAVYLEPFSYDRSGLEVDYDLRSAVNNATFYPIYGITPESIEIVYDEPYDYYVQSIEMDSHYFYDYREEEYQKGYIYQCKNVGTQFIGISLWNHKLTNFDFSVQGNSRPYSNDEYNNAIELIMKTNDEIEEPDLKYMSEDLTIINAEKMCEFDISDTDIHVILSAYPTRSYEFAATVYVMDFIVNNELLRAYEKENWYSL